MNRIYQGRAGKVEKLKRGGKLTKEEDWLPFDTENESNSRQLGQQTLWQHHVVFQEAVNYYVVCLLGLAQPGNALFPIREKLDAHDANGVSDERMVWRPFRRRGAVRTGMCESVAKYFTPGNDRPSPEECFAAVLAGNAWVESEEGRKLLNAGLTQLLGKCTGTAGCKQAAPVFLPRLTKPAYQGSYGEDVASLSRESEAARLPFVLHAAETRADSPSLQEFGVHSIALPNEKKPKFIGTEAIKKLQGMVVEWRLREPASEAHWARLDTAIANLPIATEIPGYAATSAKGDIKFRLYAMYFFRYVECSDFTLGLLRATTRKPGANEVLPERRVMAAGAGDPIRVARGARGYVFRAFTSLPCWGGTDDGRPQWIEFDFAAFEEALKALHQVEAKAEERAKMREMKEAAHAYQRGRTKKWKGETGGEEDQRPPVLEGDPRIERLVKLVDEELADVYEMSEGVPVKYGLQPRTIRGFHELRKKWNEALKEAEPYSEAGKERLTVILRMYQKDNPNTVGSILLFEKLREESNWIIWREPTPEQERAWRAAAKLPDDAEFTSDPLQALTDERELLEEIERLKGPIRFTPADPIHSRRQFYFSDVTALDKMARLKHDKQTADVEIAEKVEGRWKRQDVRIHFTAPRLIRDQINNSDGQDSAFQQAMMEALGLRARLRKTEKGKIRDATFGECAAMALMPETDANGQLRILLNFPIKLEDDAIAVQLGKAARWDSLQFGGADKESYWLRWPGTWIDEKKERKKAPPVPWWKGTAPFQCLAVDLGQRDAGAFALLEASAGEPPTPQSRKLGKADEKVWWATLRALGTLRLPGEDAMVMRDEKWQEELSGKRGRNTTEKEWREARDICSNLGLTADKVLGPERHRYSFPEMNDRLLYALRRAQSRLARLQSWSSVAYEEKDPKRRARFEDRQKRIKEQIAEAIGARAEEKKKSDEEREQEVLECSDWLAEVEPHITKNAWALVGQVICREIEKERKVIMRELRRIADRVQPLRGRHWEWVPRADGGHCYVLQQTARGTGDQEKFLAGQRGLSLRRIEQLESLRQRCQSLNRALMQTPGIPSNLGSSKRGIELPDPCPGLLVRLEALKDQRVNQTAHLILAQALGVRLRVHAKSKDTRAAQYTHGEYERIPGREPVDFVVLENLDRYLAAQGRSRSENSRLMKWCHRAILGKLKQLCEPYGLRVLETPAAYSSKFCSRSGVAGFRAVELNPDDAKEPRWKKHLDRLREEADGKRNLDPDEIRESRAVKQLFDDLSKMNQELLSERDQARADGCPFRPKWRTLLAPQQLGPIFVPMCGNPMQADINAAINLGLRAIASPEADDIHVRVRAKREKERFVVRAENAREKARWDAKNSKPPEISIPEESSRKKLLTEPHANFFSDLGKVAAYDHAKIPGLSHPVASGRGLWGTIKVSDWKRVEEINRARTRKWERRDDEIPM